MKRILYSVCIGILALALTAGAAQAQQEKSLRERDRSIEQRMFMRHDRRTPAGP